MPLFSDHIANMYYGSSSPYSGLPYSYSSSVSPLGSSYSASYLSPGGSYSSHSSLGGYSRVPSSSRWITSSGRNYAPMLSTISERSSASPCRINSPRRLPYSTRTYGTPSYTPRPLNINTADIDVSRDRYRHKIEPSVPYIKPQPPPPKPAPPSPPKESSIEENQNGPFMPRIDGKPETGIDSSPGPIPRSTIRRGRTVVRLYTIKRKERDSPRKPTEEQKASIDPSGQETVEDQDSKKDETEFMKWREKLSEDLIYKEKKEKKTLGTKLMEKFALKDNTDKDTVVPMRLQKKEIQNSESPVIIPTPNTSSENKYLDRRCSVELLAEQCNLLDSLIRSENLSPGTLDLSKMGVTEDKKTLATFQGQKSVDQRNALKTTKSDYSLHDSLKSYKDIRDPRNFKRRSLKKSSSGGNLRRLDSITEFPKELSNLSLPAIEESRASLKQEKQKPKPKLKTKITSSVEVSAPKSPLKFVVENVTVEEKQRIPRKGIMYSSEVEEANEKPFQKFIKTIEPPSPESDGENFWDAIGKRETVYLKKRKQILEEAKETNKRALFWFPEEEETECYQDANSNETQEPTAPVINDNNDIKPEIDSEKSVNGKGNESSQIVKIDISKNPKENKIAQEENSVMSFETNTSTSDLGKEENIIVDKVKVISKLVRQPAVDNDVTTSKIIGKSASLETLNESKAKVLSEKKTKSEKVQKNVKVTGKSSPHLLPKPSGKTKLLEKSKIDGISNNNNKNQSTVQENEIQEPIANEQESKENTIKKSEVPRVPCPIHPFGLQNPKGMKDESKTVLSQKADDKLNKSDLPCPVHPFGLQKEKEDITMPQKGLSESKPDNKAITTISDTIVSSNKTITDNLILGEKAASIETKETETSLNKNDDSEIKLPASKSAVELSKFDKTDKTNSDLNNRLENKGSTHSVDDSKIISKPELEIEPKVPELNKNLKVPIKNSPGLTSNNKNVTKITSNLNKSNTSNNTSDKLVKENSGTSSKDNPPSTSSGGVTSKQSGLPTIMLQETSEIGSSDSSSNIETKILEVPDKLIVLESQDIPNIETESNIENQIQNNERTGEDNKAENTPQKDEEEEKCKETITPTRKPVKEEKAIRPLIATPRPLQKKSPQVIHSSDSSDTSSEEESSEEDDDSESSGDSTEFFECDTNPDGRTSTGSNDSGFDSSAPASPATFSQIRKGGEATATTSGSAPAQQNNTDILEQELEQSTAYDIFKKTGRFTPPARSIPRFRKYAIEDFQFIKVLGKGSFGKVLLAELRDTEYYYAVKCLKKDVVLEDDDVECTLIERKVLALGTNHPYLCHLFATFQTDSHLFFVMEYLNGGDLMFHIQQSGRFPEARARFYAAEIVSGLKFLHKRGIVYRDLKLDNILLDFEGHVRIADFGMCKLQIYLDKTADTFCGTPDYMAPEIIKGLKYNQTVDWWSFGVLLYEMLIGQSPFSGCDEDELFWSICNEMPSYPRFLSTESLTILTRLLDKDARTRLGGTECMHGDIRDQEFFHLIHWDRLERRELEAPFRPRVRHPMDTQYFDRAFTGERPRLTAVEPHVLRSMDQEPFRGFSYTNPNTTDR